jgi:hypothetical protein
MQTTSLGLQKPFSWSYSKLKNYDSCPRRHYEIDIKKNYKEDEDSDTLKWGNEVHKNMALRLNDHEDLPFAFKHFEPLAARLEAVPGKLLVEQKLAITADFVACDWFHRNAWFRSIADALVINPPVALAIDYKTGKILEDYQQLALLSACVFAHYPPVLAVRTEAWWVREDAITREDFYRKNLQDIWRQVWPRYEQLKQAHETNYYPPKPGGLCKKFCLVASCEYFGKGR